MNSANSRLRLALLEATARVLHPLISFLIQAGIGYRDFRDIAKRVFVDVASEEHGVRGRPTNVSRVAVLTGMSRKEVARLRDVDSLSRWTPDMKASPANTILHYWHYDRRYCEAEGVPRVLSFSGPGSFTELVSEYGGDLPPGAMKTELRRAGVIEEGEDGQLVAVRRFFHPMELDEDFIANIAFSMSNLAKTVTHNARVVASGSHELLRFERFAWTEHLPDSKVAALQRLVTVRGLSFLEEVDDWIGREELPRDEWDSNPQRAVGVGVYFFRED